MASFKTPVVATKTYEWSPTDAILYPTPDRDATPEEITSGLPSRVFDVQVDLSATLENGATVTHSRKHTYPAAVKSGIIGFDPVKMEPIINFLAVAPLFASFDLEIPS